MARSAGAKKLPLTEPSTEKAPAPAAGSGCTPNPESPGTLRRNRYNRAILHATRTSPIEWFNINITPEEAQLLVNLEMPERVQELLRSMLAFPRI